jgi:hypothetical protein
MTSTVRLMMVRWFDPWKLAAGWFRSPSATICPAETLLYYSKVVLRKEVRGPEP